MNNSFFSPLLSDDSGEKAWQLRPLPPLAKSLQ
jgi:hypothetical protein